MKKENRGRVGILLLIILLTIKDMMIKNDTLDKLQFNVDWELTFSTYYIDIVVLLITIILYGTDKLSIDFGEIIKRNEDN